MGKTKGIVGFLRKQPAMRRVMLALVPCIAGSVYYFGWRSLAVVIWCTIVAFVTEYIFTRQRKEKISEAVFVTACLFALVMPPGVPWHVAAIGTVFAVMFGKEVFGGFGCNIFNPALVGRCFVYICFPVALTGMWVPAADGPAGALQQWSTGSRPDAVTGATPMAHLKAGRLVLSGEESAADEIPFVVEKDESILLQKVTLLKALLFGRMSGTMGVTSALLITIGGVYLFVTKTANRGTILSTIITYAVLNQVLYWFGVDPVPGAWPAVLGGGFLFGAFYMATDPVSSPRTQQAKIIYGMIIAISTTVIRNFSIFNGGLMFSILLGNMFAPLLDHMVRSVKQKRAEGSKS